ncbi:MAG: FkbM family methyltransferase [Pleurocapsa sp. SU_5_0]|nr:FkbM family methyltransferase [Pleurocapsa sp. SU_5_0]
MMTQIFNLQLEKNIKKITQAIQQQKISEYTIKKQFEDISFDFVIGDSEGQQWYDSSPQNQVESLNPEFQFIKQLTQPGDIVFECGTHHGLTAMLLSKWVGDEGKIVSFEINQHNAAIARKNFELNKINNVILEEKGLGSQKSSQKIFNKSNSSVTPSNVISLGWLKNFIYGTNEVEIIALDDYVKTQSILPTFLKIDVEGYESEVLKGATEVLKTLPKLEIEIHTEILSRYNTSVEEIFELIDIESYQTWVQWSDEEEPQPFDLQQKIDRRVHLFAIPKQEN